MSPRLLQILPTVTADDLAGSAAAVLMRSIRPELWLDNEACESQLHEYNGACAGNDEMRVTGPGVKLTYDDFLLFPDDGKRHELIDGEHYVTPSPNRKHQKVSLNISIMMGNWLEQNPIGQIYYAPFDVIFSMFDVVEPDLLYMSNERAARVLTDANVQGAPELVIEIGSPGTRRRDETIKRRLYERSDVSEYWVVDPEIDVVRVYRRGAQGFDRPEEFRAEADETLRTPLLPDLPLPLSRIFRT